jgi:hypothetical protein
LLRDLPLTDVAWELGLNHDHERWKGHGHIINIDGSKFYDFSPEHSKGGGGAIYLVMHVKMGAISGRLLSGYMSALVKPLLNEQR